MTDDLERFVTAQEQIYPRALAELKAGRKQSHWMWFIFPQVAGLGQSAMSRAYAIQSLDEARAYLAHLPPDAPARLIEVPGFTHACCWARDWPSLMAEAQPRS